MPYSLPPEWGGSNQPGFWGTTPQIDPNTGTPGSNPYGNVWDNPLAEFMPTGPPGPQHNLGGLTEQDLFDMINAGMGLGMDAGGTTIGPGLQGDEYDVMNPQAGLPPGTQEELPDATGAGYGGVGGDGTGGGGTSGGGGYRGGGSGGGSGFGTDTYGDFIRRQQQMMNPALGGNPFPRSQPYTLPAAFPGGGGGLLGGGYGGGVPWMTGGGGTGDGQGVETGGPVSDAESSQDTLNQLLESFQTAENEANQANEGRYNDILEVLTNRLIGAQDTLGQSATGLGQAENVLADRWNRVGSALEAGEGDLESRFRETQGTLSGQEMELQEILNSLGAQEREDINSRFDQFSADTAQDLNRRGLSNTTVRPSVLRGVEEGRSDALNRLRDSLARERVGLGTQRISRRLGLDMEGLGQEERGIGRRFDYGTQGQAAGERSIERMLDLDRFLATLPAELSGDIAGVMERRTDEGPDLGQLVNLVLAFGAGGSGDFRPRDLSNQYTLG